MGISPWRVHSKPSDMAKMVVWPTKVLIYDDLCIYITYNYVYIYIINKWLNWVCFWYILFNPNCAVAQGNLGTEVIFINISSMSPCWSVEKSYCLKFWTSVNSMVYHTPNGKGDQKRWYRFKANLFPLLIRLVPYWCLNNGNGFDVQWIV